ncbi:MAG: tetratricopeptide repeat protein [Acidobacteria bacterium]|nr:tetratricopeptide repeat protein [Acidobacteriota bacterium]
MALALCSAAPGAEERPVEQLVAEARAAYLKRDHAAARKALDRAWSAAQELPARDPARYDVVKQMSIVLTAAGEYHEAEQYLQIAINAREIELGSEHPQVADELTDLAMLCHRMGDDARGLVVLDRVRLMRLRAGGPDAPALADAFSRAALLHLTAGHPEQAAAALETALSIREKTLGPVHPGLLPELDRRGPVLLMLRRYEQAEEAYRRALVIREQMFGPSEPELIPSVEGLAYSCFGQKKYAQAEPLYRRLLGLWRDSTGGQHPMVAITLDKIALFYRELERWEEADAAVGEANAIRAHLLAAGLQQAAESRLARGDKKAAHELFRRALDTLDANRPEHAELRSLLQKRLGPKPARRPRSRRRQ